MEIVIVVLLVVILAALALAWTKFRPGAAGGTRHTARGEGLRGRRAAAGAARHDPMAEAVERHAMATDPHEAAAAELRLQAQANRVAADLHAQQASALESAVHANGNGGLSRRGATAHDAAVPADDDALPGYDDALPGYDGRTAVDADGRRPVLDEQGRPVYVDGEPLFEDDHRAT